MKITGVESWSEAIPLSRPYTIAFKTTTAVELPFVRIKTDCGNTGVGSASPGEHVDGLHVSPTR